MPESPALSPDLIAALRCPETHQPLGLASSEQLDRVRAALPAADEANPESRDIEGALLTEDGRIAYPVRDGFPILLLAEAIRIPVPGEAETS